MDESVKDNNKAVTLITVKLEEKAKLLRLPHEPFEVYRLEAAVLDKYGRVSFEGRRRA